MTSSVLLPDETTNDVWPGVCPSDCMAVMPGVPFLAPFAHFQILGVGAKDAHGGLEGATGGFRHGVHLGLVHEVGMVARWHDDFCVGINQFAFLGAQAVDVVGVIVRDQNRIDGLRVNAGGWQGWQRDGRWWVRRCC